MCLELACAPLRASLYAAPRFKGRGSAADKTKVEPPGLIFRNVCPNLRPFNRLAKGLTGASPKRPRSSLCAQIGGFRDECDNRLTAKMGAARDAAPRATGRYRWGRIASGRVFDIVDLERETQAAASWRWCTTPSRR